MPHALECPISAYGHSPTMTAIKGLHRYSNASPLCRYQSAQLGNHQQHDSPSSSIGIPVFNGQFLRRIGPVRDESFAKIESDRTHVDCSVEITANQSGICSCQSIALAFNLGDRDRDRILSDALRHCRQNHLLERTGEWLFGSDTFKKWREMSRSSILWVVAFPGMGKSMLSSAVLEMLDTNRNLGDIVTFFFCDGRFKAGDWILGVLSNLVCELLSRNANQQSEDRLTALAMDLANIEDGLSSQELRCFLSVIQHSLKPHETLFLVLDGFDDTLDGQSGHDLVHTFLDFSNSSNTRHRIKIFVSSSPNYSPCLNLGSVLRVDIDQEPFARVDLHAYVRRGVQNLQLSDPSQDFKNTAELLSSNRNSTFLSAGLTLRNLSKGSSPLNVLTHIWDTSPSCFLSKIYKDMLNRIVEKDRMRSLFKWIVYSARPLSLEELDYALQPATGPSERDICAASGGLLTIGKSQTVNFLHLTARDYLLSLSEGDVYWMGKPSMAHEMIAQTCLKALSPVELLQCLDLLTQGNHPGNTHQHTKFTYARHYLIFHYMLGEPHSHSLPGLIHHSLKRSMESEDFKVHAHSVAELQEIQLNTVRSCGSTASQCMISRMILEVAADLGFEKLARLELQMGGDAHLSCKHSSRAALHPIHLAARGGHLNVVKLLLEYGADLTTLSNSGQTPLFYAIAKGSPDIMRLLLTHEIKPSSASFTNKEPSLLSCATQRTIQHMCELFLVARISDICTQCTDKQPHYIISMPPQDDQDSNPWPPIYFTGEPISGEEIPISSPLRLCPSHTFLFDGEERGEKATIKWFAGADMYHALGIAARRGIGTVRDLLLAADNDTSLINRFTSVTELVSNLRIS